MVKTIILKELKSMLLSPKFTATFGVCSVLLLLSVYVGIKEYRASVAQYESARGIVEQRLREARSWHSLSNRIYRAPNPMQVFVSGVNNDIGRTSTIDPTEPIELTNSAYSDEPIYAVFRFIDFAFIVQVVFSLFAILFTYDSINGERENGTLQLTFSNAVPRVQYIFGKFIGSWLGLIVPLSLPILLSVLLVVAFNVPFTQDQWLAVVALISASFLFLTCFISLGIFISTVTKRPSTSFLFSLVIWIAITFIIPRAGVMTAGILQPVASVAEIQAQRDAYSKEAWSRFRRKLEERLQARNAEMRGKTREEREAFSEENEWAWMELESKARKAILQEIDEYGSQLASDARNAKQQQELLALSLARFSPASAFQLSAMTLAGVNIDLKSRYEDALNAYRTMFTVFREKKEKESGETGGIRVMFDSERGLRISVGRDSPSLDVSDMPRFIPTAFTLIDALQPALLDAALLAIYTFLAFAGAFIAFLRHDIR